MRDGHAKPLIDDAGMRDVDCPLAYGSARDRLVGKATPYLLSEAAAIELHARSGSAS
jgi:hypothetical protein